MAWKYEIALRLLSKQPRMKRADRPRCGARTRKGRPCRAPAVWDRGKDQARNGRCRLHGGLSTGPKTVAGIERIRQAVTKHGFYTKAAVLQRQLARLEVKRLQQMIQNIRKSA